MLVVALDMIGLKIGSYGLRGAIAGPGPCMGSAGLPVPKGAGASAGNCTINIYICQQTALSRDQQARSLDCTNRLLL